MPYFVHVREQEIEPGAPSYLTAAEAHQSIVDPSVHTVSFVPSFSEEDDWRYRMRERFSSGEYVHVPWSGSDRYLDHYVHLSTEHKCHVAYTASIEHGVLDRQTRTTPGRYLQKFYPDLDKRTREGYIARCTSDNIVLCFARTVEEIKRVYSYRADGDPLWSCMTKDIDRYDSAPIHPVEAYADSDIAIAYFGPIDRVLARCVCWPDRKLYGRQFGDYARLRSLLEAQGYTSGSMQGARIRKIVHDDDVFVVPYVDGISRGRVSGRWIVLGSGPIDLQQTSGLSRDRCRDCENCGSSFDPDDTGNSEYCQSCLDDSYTCDGCNDLHFDADDMHSTENHYYCSSCYDDRCTSCAVCDESFLEEEEFSYSERRDRRSHNVTDLCRSCARSHRACSQCGSWFDTDDHPEITCPSCTPDDSEQDSDSDDSSENGGAL